MNIPKLTKPSALNQEETQSIQPSLHWLNSCTSGHLIPKTSDGVALSPISHSVSCCYDWGAARCNPCSGQDYYSIIANAYPKACGSTTAAVKGNCPSWHAVCPQT